MTAHRGDAWADAVRSLADTRTEKPRDTGITALIDKGLGLGATHDLVEMAGHVIDHVKFGFGTSATLDADLVRRKVAMLVDAGIVVYPGGTLLEAAWAVGRMDAFIDRTADLGFNGIEVSDGTVDMPDDDRGAAIRRAIDAGLEVITEVGRKDPGRQLSAAATIARIQADLDRGARLVTIEARESGRGTGIFDRSGDVMTDLLETLLGSIRDVTRILWEAPQPDQQAHLILRLGPNVNLANIAPAEVLALEALRRAFRFETLKAAVEREGIGGTAPIRA